MEKLDDIQKDMTLNEIRIQAGLAHSNIAEYKEAFVAIFGGYICLVMEYFDDGDLQAKITDKVNTKKYFKEKEIWAIFIQMVRGLFRMHEANVNHRDIKSANIFLKKDGTVKLGDFSAARKATTGVLQMQIGSPLYASPEVWEGKAYDYHSDIWSLGVVLYEMTCLHHPFVGNNMD